MRRDIDAIDIPLVLKAEDVVKICRISTATLYRWLKESRDGIDNNFPLPIDTGGTKRRLLWSRDAIENFLNGGEQRNIKIETATQRKQRANAARADLQRRGVRVNDSEK